MAICVMWVSMSVCWQLPGILLLLVLTGLDGSEGAEKQHADGSPEEQGARIRELWKLHMKGKDVPPVAARSKQQLLYCRVGIGFHLQILPSGLVGGVHEPTKYCWFRVCAVEPGVVAVRGVDSGMYLCMSAEGRSYGAEKFSKDCMLKENLEENHYNTYSSVTHPHVYLALSHMGNPKRAVSHHQACTHFLPRRSL
ncbi:fibroblast growth factor 4A-like [Salarias fasciatus]|uniref:fibroblast growth factor 4A-like n=1 Tax=Salarias fasciatus TaxID=181472 RepID=UPI001176E8F6|nr:fibroblast growth factor 4A-like [Salarias fasciatus]